MAEKETTGLLALLAADPEGGWNVIDARDGEALAWRGEVSSADEVARFLNATYPPDCFAPAHDSLVHEICMFRIGGEPERPISSFTPAELSRMVPDGIDDRPALWKPIYEED
jgi:hypothetical protein